VPAALIVIGGLALVLATLIAASAREPAR